MVKVGVDYERWKVGYFNNLSKVVIWEVGDEGVMMELSGEKFYRIYF